MTSSLRCVIILMFGSRDWNRPETIEAVVVGKLMLARAAGEILTIVHGNHGNADKYAGEFGTKYGATVIPVDADWKQFHRAAGPIRNGVMLKDFHPQEGWGFRMPGDSPGTDDMIDRLQKACVPYVVTHNPAAASPTLF